MRPTIYNATKPIGVPVTTGISTPVGSRREAVVLPGVRELKILYEPVATLANAERVDGAVRGVAASGSKRVYAIEANS
ncbi:hypothetical protein D3C86_1974800 [compost metagenome]